MSEPSVVSGDGDSEVDEVDQICATPAPESMPQSDRPTYKRKESDWEVQRIPKRAKYDQSNSIWDYSRKGNQSTSTFTWIAF